MACTCTCCCGACCQTGGECSLETEDGCAAVGGSFKGIGTTCDPNPCEFPRCFPTSDEVIEGYDVTISGIANGNDCTCDASINVYVPFDETELGVCGFVNSGTADVSSGCGFHTPVEMTVSLSCTAGGPISLSIELEHTGLDSNDWGATFSAGTAPADVKMTNQANTFSDQGFACDYDNATATATPRLVDNCFEGNPLP